MKKLLILLIITVLTACGTNDPNKKATIEITDDNDRKDTIIVEYYKFLRISGVNKYLVDGNGNAFAGDVYYFSIIDTCK